MLRALLFNQETGELRSLLREELLTSAPDSQEQSPPEGSTLHGGTPRCRPSEFLWVDVTDPDEADFQLLASRFQLHPMILEDMKSQEGRPKLHNYDDYLYLIFHAIQSQNGTPHLQEIDCLVGPDYVVTMHHQQLQPLEDLRTRWLAHPTLMKAGAAYLLYELMDEVLDDYFPTLDMLDERIDRLEEALFHNNTNGDRHITAEIFSLKRDLLQIRRIAGPTRDVVNILLRRDAERGGKNFVYFQDLYDHVMRIVDMTDTFRDILSGALDAYLAVESNRMNAIMKTLTSASIILLVPNLLAAIYGMNFSNMPELQTRYGYFVVIGVMATLMLSLYANFKRKGWL
jgi:magnesium transporter